MDRVRIAASLIWTLAGLSAAICDFGFGSSSALANQAAPRKKDTAGGEMVVIITARKVAEPATVPLPAAIPAPPAAQANSDQKIEQAGRPVVIEPPKFAERNTAVLPTMDSPKPSSPSDTAAGTEARRATRLRQRIAAGMKRRAGATGWVENALNARN